MRTRINRSVTSLALGSALAALSACGGGSGGSSTLATIPGVLAAIALEGASAPGTGAGTYGPFGPSTLVDVADGGWTAFTDTVSLGTTTKALFCRRPDGVVVNVFSVGNSMPTPNGGGGTINDFLKIWMCPGTGTGGIVVAFVSIAGGNTEGIIAARVPTSAAVTEKSGVMSRSIALSTGFRGSGAPGNVLSLSVNLVQVDDQGDVFFVAAGTTGVEGIWTITRQGTGLDAISVTNDTVPGGALGFTIDGLGIDGDGLVIAYAADVTGGATHAIIATNSHLSTGVLVSKTGDTPPSVGLRTFDNVYPGGPLFVTNGGGSAYCIWEGDLSGSAPDKGIFSRQVMAGGIPVLGTLDSIAVPGQPITGLGLGAIMSTIELLDGSIDPNRMPILTGVAGGTATKAIFSSPNSATTNGVWHDGETVPGTPATTFATTTPSLTLAGIKHGNRVGSLAFSAVLVNAQSGVYWEILSGGVFLLFQVARQGDPAPTPPTGTFGSFASASPVVTASTFVVFTSSIVGGTSASGLFIQG